jgi:hypothetical protein
MPNIDAYKRNIHADAYAARGEAVGNAARWLGTQISRRFRRQSAAAPHDAK